MRILMVGLGSIGQRHLRNILAVQGNKAEISAYRVRKEEAVVTADLSIEAGATLGATYRYDVFDDLEAALAALPEAVFICNPSSLHVPVALAAARRGCHLFIEKPLSDTMDGIPELIRVVEARRLVALVGFQLRFHPCLARLRSLIAEERVGRLLAVHVEVGEYLPGWHRWEDYRRMYAARRDLGGGVVLTQIHELDYATDLFGPPRSVYALGGQLSSLEVDVEDTALVLMDCAFRGRPLPVFVHMDYCQRPPTRRCRVIGERGTITMDLRALEVVTVDPEGRTDVYRCEALDRNQLFLDEVRHFFACLAGEARPVVDLRAAAVGMRIGLAIRESLGTGARVSLECSRPETQEG